MNPVRSIFISVLFILLISFIWYAGLKPLYINEDVNIADRYARTGKCDKALDLMRSKVIYNPSTIDSYAKLKYISIIERCNARSVEAIELLKKVAEIRPYYTRTYLFLGNYTGDKSYFDKAEELSPNHEEIFVGKIKIDMAKKDYSLAQKEAEKCLQINPKSNYCWLLKILSDVYLGDIEEALQDIELAKKVGLSQHNPSYLSQMFAACETTGNKRCYEELFKIYEELIKRYTEDAYSERREKFLYIGEKLNKTKESKEIIKNYDNLLKPSQ